jgi:gluconolactonase
MTTPRCLIALVSFASVLPLAATAQPATPAAAAAPAPATTSATAASSGSGTRGRGGPRAGGPNTTMGLPPTISSDAKVEKLAALPKETYTVDGAPFTEGATCAPNGDVYFVEQNSDKIMRWDVANKKLSVFMHPSGYSNGMSFDYHGNLISCADERNELWSISLTDTETGPYPAPLNPAVGDQNRSGNVTLPKHTVLLKDYQGKLLGGPNDVWIRPDGGMYLTDPHYNRKWWDPARAPAQEVDKKSVFYFSPDHKTLTRVIDDFNTPNGIAGTPDGKTLYVADIGAGQTWAYDIQPDGTLKNKKLVCSFGSDGMTLDDHGNLYLSTGGRGAGNAGVTVVDTKTGKQIGFIAVPEQPANMCFAGKDRSTLYMTARTGFYAIPTNVKGANPGK